MTPPISFSFNPRKCIYPYFSVFELCSLSITIASHIAGIRTTVNVCIRKTCFLELHVESKTKQNFYGVVEGKGMYTH